MCQENFLTTNVWLVRSVLFVYRASALPCLTTSYNVLILPFFGLFTHWAMSNWRKGVWTCSLLNIWHKHSLNICWTNIILKLKNKIYHDLLILIAFINSDTFSVENMGSNGDAKTNVTLPVNSRLTVQCH